MANTSAIWQRAAHTTYQLSSPSCSTGVIKRPNSQQKSASLLVKVIRMDYQHKSDQMKSARGLCRKTGFLHSSNSSFTLSCGWIYLLKANLKTFQESLNNEINHYFSFKDLMTIPFLPLTGQSIGWRKLGSSPPCSACQEPLAWVAPGACRKQRSAWGAKTPRRPPGPHPSHHPCI